MKIYGIKLPLIPKKINLSKFYKLATKDKNKMFIYTYSIGLAASSAAHIVGVKRNENMSMQEKLFLIPQEIAEAAINIGIFMFLSLGLKNYTDKMFEYGKIKIPEIDKFVQKYMKENNIKDSKDLLKKGIQISDILKSDINQYIKFNKYKNGASWIISILGSIISCNIITPFLRNIIAAKYQHKKINMKDDKTKDNFVSQKLENQ